ncbi:MAG: carbohydrate-binding protein [Candidatus Faecousia sp.]|nr:carbohydrate-binding protein [Candidatus Faecousia sp.]
MTRKHALALRAKIEQASASLPDEDALAAVELFPAWKPETDYTKGERVRYGGLLYRLIPEKHHSQADWPPNLTPAVWARVDNPGEEWPEWRQPLGSEDAYLAGAKVSHGGKHWINTHGDGNIWEPGVFGWTEAQ